MQCSDSCVYSRMGWFISKQLSQHEVVSDSLLSASFKEGLLFSFLLQKSTHPNVQAFPMHHVLSKQRVWPHRMWGRASTWKTNLSYMSTKLFFKGTVSRENDGLIWGIILGLIKSGPRVIERHTIYWHCAFIPRAKWQWAIADSVKKVVVIDCNKKLLKLPGPEKRGAWIIQYMLLGEIFVFYIYNFFSRFVGKTMRGFSLQQQRQWGKYIF